MTKSSHRSIVANMTTATAPPTTTHGDAELVTFDVRRDALAALPIGEFQLSAGTGKRDGRLFTFDAVIRTTAVLNHWLWGPLVHDFDGCEPAAERQQLNWNHDDWTDDKVLGYFENVRIEDGETGRDLVATPTLVSTQDDDTAAAISTKLDAGVPYGLSIEFPNLERDDYEIEWVDVGETADVNGVTLAGPLTIFRRWPLRGLALCGQGYDPHATAQLSAKSAESVPLTLPGDFEMLFKRNAALAAKTKPAAKPADEPTPAADPVATEEPTPETAPAATEDPTPAADPAPAGVGEGQGASMLSASDLTGDPLKDAAKLAGIYAERYGVRGAEYLSAGLSIEDADGRELVASRKEREADKQEIAKLSAKLEQLGESFRGEAEPVASGNGGGTGNATGQKLSARDHWTKQFVEADAEPVS